MGTPTRQLQRLLADLHPSKPIVFLTGAGISAESGIPTFRGEGGYWRVGSKVYMPQQMATRANFQRQPREVWRWYLYRRGVCRAGAPNPAHHALAALERARPEVFHLITQNIDGLHRIAGNSAGRIYEIHGNGEEMRCAGVCTPERYPIPEGVGDKRPDQPLTDTRSPTPSATRPSGTGWGWRCGAPPAGGCRWWPRRWGGEHEFEPQTSRVSSPSTATTRYRSERRSRHGVTVPSRPARRSSSRSRS